MCGFYYLLSRNHISKLAHQKIFNPFNHFFQLGFWTGKIHPHKKKRQPAAVFYYFWRGNSNKTGLRKTGNSSGDKRHIEGEIGLRR